VLGNKPSSSTQTTTAAPKPSRVPLTCFSADIKGIFGFKYRKMLSPALILVSSNFIETILRLKVLASLKEDLPLSSTRDFQNIMSKCIVFLTRVT
jgi:hypothetical protein